MCTLLATRSVRSGAPAVTRCARGLPLSFAPYRRGVNGVACKALVLADLRAARLIVSASASAPPSTSPEDDEPVPVEPVAPTALKGKQIFVAGATGGVGKQVVELLAKQGVAVTALVRDTSTKGAALPGAGTTTTVVKGDVYQFQTLPPALDKVDAIVCATGARDPRDPLGPFTVDYQGTLNLIAAARQKGIKKFVFVTSIGADDLVNPLNLFWGVLFWKKRAEEELQRSGLNYTIVRPGGLKNTLRSGEKPGAIVMGGPGTWGVPPLKKSGSILRSQVAEVCVAALVESGADNKVVEVIAEPGTTSRTLADLFASV